MKFVTYRLKTEERPYQMGILNDEMVYDLAALITEANDPCLNALNSHPDYFYRTLPADFQAVEEKLTTLQLGDGFLLSEVKLGPVVTAPEKIICIGTNYKDHVIEMGHEMPLYPVLFSKFSNALIGTEDVIEGRGKTEALDYEVELAVVIGKQATEVTEADAFDYVLGYTIANDTSARDLQKRTPQWLQGKSLDRSTPVGPYLLTKAELPDPGMLNIQSFVNGELRQTSNTNQLIFSIAHLIAFISDLITLAPGDIILTGTPAGVGFARTPKALLKDGDRVQMTIDQLGELNNTVKRSR